MFAGWEGVGLCSYLLIGFYFREDFPPFAGRKAFIVNRIGDLGFLLALFALLAHFGTLRFGALFPLLEAQSALGTGTGYLGMSIAAFAALFLFVGAMGKSAQLPLYVWLPDAMAGPTPVSALIHAATMVTAGVYMVARSHALYALAPGVSSAVAWIGALTAIFAATIALAQDDLKKVLAYSTVSQLGYMFVAAGLGAYAASIFHLMTHAFFKALLFLGAGSVIHALAGEQDLKKMGGLAKALPVTSRTMLIGAAALAGVPPLAGFFSKDEILHAAAARGEWGLWAIGLATAGLTAFYMTRAYLLAFTGEFRGSEEARHHLHESPRSMTIPLGILAAGAVLVGFLGLPAIFAGENGNLFHRFLVPVVGDHAEGAAPTLGEGPLMLIAIAVAALGILLAWRLYGRGRGLRADDAFAARAPFLHRLLARKYYVDEAYDAAIVRPTWGLARLLYRFDARAIDGFLVHGLRHLTVLSSLLSGFFDKYFVDGLVNLVGWLPRRASYRLRRLQNGLLSRQALALLAGLFLLVFAYLALDRGALSWWIGGGGS
jgi:NADH-quinone oxidoreductase subunit L